LEVGETYEILVILASNLAIIYKISDYLTTLSKLTHVSAVVRVKVIPRQAEVAQGVPGSLTPRIFLMFGTTRVVGRQPYAPAAFTPGEIPGTHFQRLTRLQGTWFSR